MNPYASPVSDEPPAELGRSFPFDIGKSVGRYLQGLALLALISAVIDAIFFDRWRIDLIPLLMLVFGHHLAAHRSGARTATIWLLGIILLLVLVMLLCGLILGTENIHIHVGREIEDPQLWHVLTFCGLSLILFGVPLWLLCTPQATAEFSKARRLTFDRLDAPPESWTNDDDS